MDGVDVARRPALGRAGRGDQHQRHARGVRARTGQRALAHLAVRPRRLVDAVGLARGRDQHLADHAVGGLVGVGERRRRVLRRLGATALAHDGALHAIAPGADGAFYETYENGPSLDDWTPFAALGRPQAASPPPLTGGPAPAGTLRRLVVTIGFTYTARRRTTRLKSLTVKDMPRGGMVSARCARGCSRKSLVKRNVKSSRVSLSALVKKPLKVGTRITITATAPGPIGAVKTLTIRSRKAPAVKTRCLPPGRTKPASC